MEVSGQLDAQAAVPTVPLG